MKLCDYCGFVIKDNDAKCSNCRMIVPGRESMLVPPKLVSSPKKVQTQISSRSISSYIPKKFIAILLVIGLFSSPHTQTLLNGGLNYWDELNTIISKTIDCKFSHSNIKDDYKIINNISDLTNYIN